MSMMPGPGAVDLTLAKEMNRDQKAQERMSALQMVLDMHTRGIPVIVEPNQTIGAVIGTDGARNGKVIEPKQARKQVYEAVEKWRKFIFDGEAIGG